MAKSLNYLDLEALLPGLRKCGNQTAQPFRNKIVRNISTFTQALKEQYETEEKVDGMDEFIKKETAIIQQHAVSYDEKHQPIFGDNIQEVKELLAELREEHTDILSKYDAIRKNFREKVMTQEVDCPIRYIEETEIPKQLNVEQMTAISPLIKWSDEKDEPVMKVKKKK